MAKKRKDEGKRILTAEFRMSYPVLFKAQQIKGKGDFLYTLKMLFPKDEGGMQELRKFATECIKEKWPKFNRKKKPKKFGWPFVNGDKTGVPEEEGYWTINCKSKNKPQVRNAAKNPIVNESEIYPGCWGRATLTPLVYSNASDGFSFWLGNVIKTRDDEPIAGGGRSAEDDFEDIEPEDEDDENDDDEGDDDGDYDDEGGFF